MIIKTTVIKTLPKAKPLSAIQSPTLLNSINEIALVSDPEEVSE